MSCRRLNVNYNAFLHILLPIILRRDRGSSRQPRADPIGNTQYSLFYLWYGLSRRTNCANTTHSPFHAHRRSAAQNHAHAPGSATPVS